MVAHRRDVAGVEAGDVIGVRYESVHGSNAAEHSHVLTVTDATHNVSATDSDGNEYVVRTDVTDATELAKMDKFGNDRRIGWVSDVTRIGWI